MAAGSGLTAVVDASITRTLVGAAAGTYAAPALGAMWCSLYTNNMTASLKSPATGVEWLTSSDTNYARQPLGTGGTNTSGWTINAYSNGVGVVFTNFATLTQPAVAGAQQFLGSVGFADTVGPTGGNIDLFADLNTVQTVNVGVQVVLTATTGVSFTTY